MILVGKQNQMAAFPLAIDAEGDGGAQHGQVPAEGRQLLGAVTDKYFDGHGVFAGTVVVRPPARLVRAALFVRAGRVLYSSSVLAPPLYPF